MFISYVQNDPGYFPPCLCLGLLGTVMLIADTNLKQNEARSARAESTHKGVN